jgi:hypothetical protein
MSASRRDQHPINRLRLVEQRLAELELPRHRRRFALAPARGGDGADDGPTGRSNAAGDGATRSLACARSSGPRAAEPKSTRIGRRRVTRGAGYVAPDGKARRNQWKYWYR